LEKIAMIGLFTALQHMTEQGDLNGINKTVTTVLHSLATVPTVATVASSADIANVAVSNVETAVQLAPVVQPVLNTAIALPTAPNLATADVKSPMVGVFYASSSPDAAPFVHIGDTIQKGDVLCILEAMKLMNEIHAEQDGKIIDICVKNGDLVEFGQTIFKLESA